MKRGIITNNGQGIYISDGEIWMTTWELLQTCFIQRLELSIQQSRES